MNGSTDMRGWSAILTGGASGLGLAATQELAKHGVNCVIFDMNEDAAKDAADALNKLGNGTKHSFVSGDVTNEGDVKKAIELARTLGPLRIVVNCAGIGHAWKTVDRKGRPMPLEAFQRPIQINLIGSFNVARLGAAEMVNNSGTLPDGQRGVVVNVASVAGGVVGMTLPMARDLASFGVRVNTIAPGIFNTPLLQALPEDVKRGLAADVPNPHRLGEPAEFGALVRHICENAYFNGETIRLDGALRMPPKSSGPQKAPAKL